MSKSKPAKPKRIITPHKGGRTKRGPSCWMTPEDLRKLKQYLEDHKMSFGDWLHQILNGLE